MDSLAEKINFYLKESAIYKRFLAAKKNVNDNDKLKEIKTKMQELKKANCKKNNDVLINEYYVLEKVYRNNVLVKEYERAKEEIYLLISEISDILSFK